MDQSCNTKHKNSELISNAMKLADDMLVMAQNGVPDCEDEGCMMIYGVIRDCGYKIRRTIEHEQISGIANFEHH